jgi:hypothetical protein
LLRGWLPEGREGRTRVKGEVGGGCVFEVECVGDRPICGGVRVV